MSVSTRHSDVSVPGRLEEVADGVFAYIPRLPAEHVGQTLRRRGAVQPARQLQLPAGT